MKRLFLVSSTVLLFSAICFASIKAKYYNLHIPDLPAGSTIQIKITGTGIFSVNGSTTTSYTTNYVIPKNSKEIGDEWAVKVSSQSVYLIIHGELKK